jgi:hypothetical protein
MTTLLDNTPAPVTLLCDQCPPLSHASYAACNVVTVLATYTHSIPAPLNFEVFGLMASFVYNYDLEKRPTLWLHAFRSAHVTYKEHS